MDRRQIFIRILFFITSLALIFVPDPSSRAQSNKNTSAMINKQDEATHSEIDVNQLPDPITLLESETHDLNFNTTDEARLLATTLIDFKTDLRNQTIVLTNGSENTLNWSIDTDNLPSWILRIYPTSGEIEIGQTNFIHVCVSRQNLSPGTHKQSLSIDHEDGTAEKVSLQISVPAATHRHLHVKSSAQGIKDGSSWENAFTRINDAIAFVGKLGANETVEIWVSEGIYYEHEIFVPSGIQLYGGFQGDETVRDERAEIWNHPAIVDGQKQGRCFECLHRTIIDGFVIQNGRDWSAGEGKGAAILAYDADIIIRNNLIRDNVDSWAGAVFVEGFDTSKKVENVSPLIEYNVLTNNFSVYCAAAIEIRGTKATVRHNTIVNNKGFGLEIQDLLGPYQQVIYGNFYNNIITDNIRLKEDDVWAEARKVTNYCYIGKTWPLDGAFEPYDYGVGNIFKDQIKIDAGFIDAKNGNYRLKIGSPCIDAGDPQSKADADGTRADLGAFPFNHERTVLEVLPKCLDFGTASRMKILTIQAYVGKPIQWKVASHGAEEALSISPDSGELKNGEQATLQVAIDRESLTDGIYEGYVAVMASDQSHEVKVTFIENNSKSEIVIDPTDVKVEAMMNGPNPQSQPIRIDNAVVGDLFWTAQNEFTCNWLHLSPTSGKDGDRLTLDFNISQLGFGEYHADIRITGQKAINEVILPVDLTMKPARFIFEIEAEKSKSLPNIGWQTTVNDGSACVQALENSIDNPNEKTRIDYEFTVPDGIEFVYLFAEVDVNQSQANDSFWISVNGFDLCPWDYIHSRYDGWIRSWVYHKKRDKQHGFVVTPDKNTLNLYSREAGGFINWLVITNDPNVNIQAYRIGSSE